MSVAPNARSFARRSLGGTAFHFAATAASCLLLNSPPLLAQPRSLETYEPDVRTRVLLGSILPKIREGRPIQRSFAVPPRVFMQLPTREIYFDAAYETIIADMRGALGSTGQTRAASSAVIYTGTGGGNLDPERVPYIALPAPSEWLQNYGVRLGDYAALIYDGVVAFAVFGELGSVNKLGAGSPALMRTLGVRERATTYLSASNAPFIATIVFPGSGAVSDRADEATLLRSIRLRGREMFERAGGRAGVGSVEQLQERLQQQLQQIQRQSTIQQQSPQWNSELEAQVKIQVEEVQRRLQQLQDR